MGDSGDEILLETNDNKKVTKETTGSNPPLDISDVVKLVTGVLQSQFQNLSGQLKAEQSESIAKKLKENSTLKIKSEGNRAQYDFNADILEGLEKLEIRAFENKDKKLPTTPTMRRKLEALKTEPLGIKGKPRTSVSTRMAPTELLQRQQRQARQPSLLLVLPLLLHLSHIHVHISSSPFVANSQGVNHSPATYASTVFPLDTGKPTAPKTTTAPKTSHKVNDKYTVPDRRIGDAICCLQKTIIHFPDVTARELARVVGKIISMTPVMDIFKVGRWTGINCGLQDHRLAELASELPRYCVTSKAENTAEEY
ncbi:uncharacterized protein LOC134275628, partial [Saccostrea cucullata]|uniref:uncharacterized protein LOC134275628 n=1 Tax=Saccostrea cuccullata TaxID=36930 RepID=UPI002ED5B39A